MSGYCYYRSRHCQQRELTEYPDNGVTQYAMKTTADDCELTMVYTAATGAATVMLTVNTTLMVPAATGLATNGAVTDATLNRAKAKATVIRVSHVSCEQGSTTGINATVKPVGGQKPVTLADDKPIRFHNPLLSHHG